MRKPQGYAFESDEILAEKLFSQGLTRVQLEDAARGREWDTITCNHCQHVVRFQTRAQYAERVAHCRLCDKDICLRCHDKGQCTPFEEKIREQETRAANRRAYEQT